jgi:hypothetical protein
MVTRTTSGLLGSPSTIRYTFSRHGEGVCDLASAAPSFTTGSTVGVDGGYTSR